jgi:hypothetical protein
LLGLAVACLICAHLAPDAEGGAEVGTNLTFNIWAKSHLHRSAVSPMPHF